MVNDDSKKITKVPGIGPKLASRIVLELKDKLKKDNSLTDTEIPKINLSAAGSNVYSEAAQALMVLGFTNGEAQSALEGLSPDLTVQELIKEALKRSAPK